MNHQSNPIQAVFGDSFFLKHRIYIALGIGSVLANICLVFADLILFWMEIAFLIYHVSSTSNMNFITANFVFPVRLWLSKLKIQDHTENVVWLQAKICIRINFKTIRSFVSGLILFSILIFYLSERIEKRTQLFLFQKFRARFDKSIKLFNDHAPVQQEFLDYVYNDED